MTIDQDRMRAALRSILKATDVQETMRLAAIRDAIRQATAEYWLRRSESLNAVCTESAALAALNCRRHAWLISDMDDPWPGFVDDYAAVMAERETQPERRSQRRQAA